jgi:hypothetical protein
MGDVAKSSAASFISTIRSKKKVNGPPGRMRSNAAFFASAELSDVTSCKHFLHLTGACDLIEPLAELRKTREPAVKRTTVLAQQHTDGEIVTHRQAGEHGMLLGHIADAEPNPLLGRQLADVARVDRRRNTQGAVS